LLIAGCWQIDIEIFATERKTVTVRTSSSGNRTTRRQTNLRSVKSRTGQLAD